MLLANGGPLVRKTDFFSLYIIKICGHLKVNAAKKIQMGNCKEDLTETRV